MSSFMLKKASIDGYIELIRSMGKIDSIPKRTVTKAAKKGATIARKSAKTGNWIDQTGNLRKGIILGAEKSKKLGKKVYDVTIDKNMNKVFQKATKSGKVQDNKTKKSKTGNYYYPASQEYGFRTVNGGFVPGFHYMRDGLTKNASKINTEVLSTVINELKKV